MKYYYCRYCGNLFETIAEGASTPTCCARDMAILECGVTDGATEAHVPCCKINHVKCGDIPMQVVKIKIGSAPHPVTEAHHIDWIELETTCGMHRVKLNGATPKVKFYLPEEERVLNIYSYCNIHGLWKADITECN